LGVSFLWIGDLSRPDAVGHLPFELPFFGAGINVLPFLMTGLSFLASMLHRSPAQHPDLRRKQLRNMLLLAAAFFVLFYTFPSGMVLYWTTNNLISALKGGWRHLGKPAPGAEQGEHG
jgi:membrane protein insertase Oxa1/YidC/SpoIIIJ